MRAWIFAFMSFMALAAQAKPAADLAFAAQRYAAGDYRRAQAAYETLLKERPRSAALRYNLGNALFKAGRLGPAIAEYQRAFDLKPRDSDIRYNLNFALKRAGEELVPAGVPESLFALFYWLNLDELAGLAGLALWIAAILWSLWLVRPAARASLTTPATVAAALWLGAGGWFLIRKSLEPAQRGVIVSPAAEIRSGPGENFGVNFTAPEGRRVEILSESGIWLEIGVLKEGAKGWITAAAVERI